MFTQQELQVIYQLINRVTIQGNEAKVVVMIQQKIEGMLQPTPEESEKLATGKEDNGKKDA